MGNALTQENDIIITEESLLRVCETLICIGMLDL